MPTPIKTQAERARAVAHAATDLATQLELNNGKHGLRSMHRLLELCNAIIDLIDDGDAMAQRESLMWELRCDEGGNPVREDGRSLLAESFGLEPPAMSIFGGVR